MDLASQYSGKISAAERTAWGQGPEGENGSLGLRKGKKCKDEPVHSRKPGKEMTLRLNTRPWSRGQILMGRGQETK